MDEAATQAMLKHFYETAIDDVTGSSELYADDAVLEFPQGRERIRGKANMIAFRSAYPARVSIELHRTIGRQDLWVNEFTIRYNDANPFEAVSIMEFRDGKVIRSGSTTANPGSRRSGGHSGSSQWKHLPSRPRSGQRLMGRVPTVPHHAGGGVRDEHAHRPDRGS